MGSSLFGPFWRELLLEESLIDVTFADALEKIFLPRSLQNLVKKEVRTYTCTDHRSHKDRVVDDGYRTH
jgi:hypothetical protein